ncbi:MAG TPA: hypothetical protein VLY65_00885 [Nitrososphaerales archaeon]|nr:hypothetical protein [Nitrososphaerales archaeon]
MVRAQLLEGAGASSSPLHALQKMISGPRSFPRSNARILSGGEWCAMSSRCSLRSSAAAALVGSSTRISTVG